MSSSGSDNLSRNVYLDYIRAISALLVILYHYTYRYDKLFGHLHSYPISIQYGGRAVAVFFLLTGYFAIKYLKERTSVQYVIDRFFRIYPVYWVAVIITYILCLFFLPERSVSMKDLFLNLTMVPDLLGAEFVDGAYWTLQHQLIFYCIVCLICKMRLHKQTGKLAICWIALYSIIIVLPSSTISTMIGKACSVFLLCNQYGTAFIIGILIANIEKSIIVKEKKQIIAFGFALIWCVCLCYLGSDKAFAVYLTVSTILVSISLILTNRRIVPAQRIQKAFIPIETIAAISYPLYLLHQNIGYIIIARIERWGLTSELNLFIPLGGVLLLAWILHRFIEIPVSHIGKRVMYKSTK